MTPQPEQQPLETVDAFVIKNDTSGLRESVKEYALVLGSVVCNVVRYLPPRYDWDKKRCDIWTQEGGIIGECDPSRRAILADSTVETGNTFGIAVRLLEALGYPRDKIYLFTHCIIGSQSEQEVHKLEGSVISLEKFKEKLDINWRHRFKDIAAKL